MGAGRKKSFLPPPHPTSDLTFVPSPRGCCGYVPNGQNAHGHGGTYGRSGAPVFGVHDGGHVPIPMEQAGIHVRVPPSHRPCRESYTRHVDGLFLPSVFTIWGLFYRMFSLRFGCVHLLMKMLEHSLLETHQKPRCVEVLRACIQSFLCHLAKRIP